MLLDLTDLFDLFYELKYLNMILLKNAYKLQSLNLKQHYVRKCNLC